MEGGGPGHDKDKNARHDKCHFETGLQPNSLPHYKSARKSKLGKSAVFEIGVTVDLAGADFETGATERALMSDLSNSLAHLEPHYMTHVVSSESVMVPLNAAIAFSVPSTLCISRVFRKCCIASFSWSASR